LIRLAGQRLLLALIRNAKQRALTGTASIAKARLLEEGVLEGRHAADARADQA